MELLQVALATSPSIRWVAPAVGALVGAGLASLITQTWTSARETTAFRRAREVEALYALQDAAVKLRQAHANYAKAFRASPTDHARLQPLEMALDKWESRVDAQRARVLHDLSRIRLQTWRSTLLQRYVDRGEIAPEERAWSALHQAIGVGLKGWHLSWLRS